MQDVELLTSNIWAPFKYLVRSVIFIVVQVLFIGDVFAQAGLRVLRSYLKHHKKDFDFIIANGENVSSGRGISRKHFKSMLTAGVDIVTLGNHVWDNSEMAELLEESTRLLRPLNYPTTTPGLGYTAYNNHSGKRLHIATVMGRVYMEPLDCPFKSLDSVIERVPKNEPLIVDFHAEATSEKKTMGYHLAGHATAVIGTHTHVQTADEIVKKGTAYITDVGMTGIQDSAIGMDFESVHTRFVNKIPKRFKPAEGKATLCAVVIEIEEGKATAIRRLQWEEPLG